MLARIELECGLGAADFEMELRSRVREGDEVAEGLGACVEGDVLVGGEDEAVVEGGGCGAEGEGGVGGWSGGVGSYLACGSGGGVENLVLVCVERYGGAFDGGG